MDAKGSGSLANLTTAGKRSDMSMHWSQMSSSLMWSSAGAVRLNSHEAPSTSQRLSTPPAMVFTPSGHLTSMRLTTSSSPLERHGWMLHFKRYPAPQEKKHPLIRRSLHTIIPTSLSKTADA